jgi:hypothetical protein
MIATTMHRIGRLTKTPIASAIDRVLAHQVKSALNVGTLDKLHFSGLQKPDSNITYQLRTFSTQQVRTVTKTLHEQIKAELMDVDANSDGRYARPSNT